MKWASSSQRLPLGPPLPPRAQARRHVSQHLRRHVDASQDGSVLRGIEDERPQPQTQSKLKERRGRPGDHLPTASRYGNVDVERAEVGGEGRSVERHGQDACGAIVVYNAIVNCELFRGAK